MNAKPGELERIRCIRLLMGLTLLVTACSDDDDRRRLVVTDQALLPRGQYLVDVVALCSDCHTPRGEDGTHIAEQYLAGTECFVEAPSGNCLNAPNLTNHETGLANRSDAEIRRMITEGVRPTATGDVALFPVMPYYVYHNMTEADLDAIVTYLRTVPGVEHEVSRSGPEFELEAPAPALANADIPMPLADYPEQEAALRGRYLTAEAGVCMECHTQRIMGNRGLLDVTRPFAGGEPFEVPGGQTSISSNITSDPETGIGEWSVDEIVALLHEGVDEDGEMICPPMPVGPMGAYINLRANDALDIAHYLKSLPPVVNDIEEECEWPPPP